MTQIIKAQKPKLEVADILQKHIAEYRNSYPLGPDQHRIVSHLLNCRTPKLGGHVERCNHCGAELDTAAGASGVRPGGSSSRMRSSNGSIPVPLRTKR